MGESDDDDDDNSTQKGVLIVDYNKKQYVLSLVFNGGMRCGVDGEGKRHTTSNIEFSI